MLNEVKLIGNLGQNPEVRTLNNGNKVANFSLATSETYKDRDGQKQTVTEWHNVVIWGKLAEVAERYLTKGSQVYVSGKLKTRSWEDKDGNKKYITEIVLEQFGGKMIMLSKNEVSQRETEHDTEQVTEQDDEGSLPF
jgi:single-strand DNA-binding protein